MAPSEIHGDLLYNLYQRDAAFSVYSSTPLHVQRSLEIKSCSWKDFVSYCIVDDFGVLFAHFTMKVNKKRYRTDKD